MTQGILNLSFWRKRNRREQWLLAIMAIFLLSVLLIKGIWLPITAFLTQNRPQLIQLALDAKLMQQISDEAQRIKHKPVMTPLSTDALLAEIQQTALTWGVMSSNWHLQAEGHAVALTGPVDDFDHWLQFAATLESKQQIFLQQLQVQAGERPGQVQIKALLVHGGG